MLIVGFGRLAHALFQLISDNTSVFVYNRTVEKVKKYAEKDTRISVATIAEFSKMKVVLLLLPAGEIANFLKQHNHFFDKDTVFYNFATALKTESLKPYIKHGKIVPCKCLGHAKQMVEDQSGVFVIPKEYEVEKNILEKELKTNHIQFIEGNEEDVLYANAEATEAAIRMIVQLKKKLEKAGLPKNMINHSIIQTTRGNIKSYQGNDLGGFAKEIIKNLEAD